MDPDFMSRYLPQSGSEREAGQGQGEPVGEPDVGQTPSIGGSPSVGEAGADIEGAEGEDYTAVLPPDVVARVRSGPPPSGAAPEAGPPPQAPPAPAGAAGQPRSGSPESGERAAPGWGEQPPQFDGTAPHSETVRTNRQAGLDVPGEPPAREDTGAHSQLSGGWKAPDPERTTPVEQAAQAARSAPEPHILEARPTEHGQARRMEFAREAEQAAPPGPGYGDPRIPPPSPRLPGGYHSGHPTTVGPGCGSAGQARSSVGGVDRAAAVAVSRRATHRRAGLARGLGGVCPGARGGHPTPRRHRISVPTN